MYSDNILHAIFHSFSLAVLFSVDPLIYKSEDYSLNSLDPGLSKR